MFANREYLKIWELAFLQLIRSGNCLCVLPLQLNQSKQFVVLSSYSHLRIYRLILLCYWLDVLYLTWVTKHVTLTSVSETEFVYFYLHFTSRLTAGIYTIILTLDISPFQYINNLLIKMSRDYQS